MASDIERYRKFGNNYFILKTPSGTELTGVLLELPSFSFSTKWEESPAAAMGEELYKLVNKPEIEFLASTTNNARVIRRTGNLTSKVYENAEPVSFELKFRCYPGQSFGDDSALTTADAWISVLSTTTTISSSAQLQARHVITNLQAAAKGAGEQIFGIVDDIKKMIDNPNEKDDIMTLPKLEEELKEVQKKIDEENEKIKKKREQGQTRGTVIGSQDLQELEAKRAELQKAIRELKNPMTDKMQELNNRYKLDDNRVKNSIKNFGASLFKLMLYPFIFKNPFIIYISTWNVNPSKEYNLSTSKSFYYDFTLSCTMDRILSGKTWEDQLI